MQKERYYIEHINYAKGIAYHLNSNYKKSNFYLKSIKQNNLGYKKRNHIEEMIKVNENYP